jgi:hypothetical protein
MSQASAKRCGFQGYWQGRGANRCGRAIHISSSRFALPDRERIRASALFGQGVRHRSCVGVDLLLVGSHLPGGLKWGR